MDSIYYPDVRSLYAVHFVTNLILCIRKAEASHGTGMMPRIHRFIVEPRRKYGESLGLRQEKVGVVVGDLRTAAWRERWRNSEVGTPTART